MYYFLASILSLDFKPENRGKLMEGFLSGKINWNGFVKLGSDNLVLPALYLNLHKHNLTAYLPDDLNEYLLGVLDLNRERNQKVLKQALFARDTFRAADIECVFMKGTANMLDGLYGDIGERMVYDLDILAEEGKMLQAAEILHKHGFVTQKGFNPRAMESTMHYPILLRSDMVAGIEVHRMAVQYLYQKNFTTSQIHKHKVEASSEDGFWVMNLRDRIIHNFLHAQLMHSGHYHADVSLRDLYDLLLLSRKEDAFEIFRDYGHYQRKSYPYLKLMHKVFDLEMPSGLAKNNYGWFFLKRQQYTLKMSSTKLRRYHLVIMFFQKYIVLPMRVLWNQKARNYVFSRLTDRSWYKQHFEAIKRLLSKG